MNRDAAQSSGVHSGGVVSTNPLIGAATDEASHGEKWPRGVRLILIGGTAIVFWAAIFLAWRWI
jgi:hypothetical protein